MISCEKLKKDYEVQLINNELNRLFPCRSIKKVLLVAPPDVDINLFDYHTAKRGRCWNFPPYGLGIIAAHLRKDSIDVQILNLNNEILKVCCHSSSMEDFNFDNTWKMALSKEVKGFNPDIVGVTCMFTQTNKSAANVCNELRHIEPDLPVAIGGVHITNCFIDDKVSARLSADFINVDLFFLYEAELAFKRFVKVVNKELSANELCQVYFNTSGERFYISDKKIPAKSELDIIPAHDLMTPEELMNYGVVGSFFCFTKKGTRITTVLSNRGCRGQCTYCSVKNFNGPGVRHRSIESIIAELLLLRDKYNIGHIMWLDDDLLYDHKRAIALFKEMARRKTGITWDCTNGVIALSCTEEVVSNAAESGCIGLTIGVESGNPEILKKVKKPGTVDTFIKAAMVLRKYEQINTRVFLMIGFPGETYQMILDTFNLAKEMDLDWYNITIFEPLPNTPIFESVVEEVLPGQIGFESIRYNSGPYGKTMERLNKNLTPQDSSDPFKNVDLDAVPSKHQLDDIWFYMNFYLNFTRLYKEDRPVKLQQHLKYVQNITDLVAPEDPFPMYFCMYLQKKVLGRIDISLIKRLEDRLSASEHWRKKFEDFNISKEEIC